VPGWARRAVVTAASCAASGICCGPAPGRTCWICTGTVAEWVWLCAARFSEEFRPNAKITAVAPNATPADAAQAHQVIAEAHEETKAALSELRNLIRGLHPPVLEDRGLDAALSGVAARMPIPVRLTVDVPRRPPPTIEAVAYFVVSEGLTNITKHAQATQAEVFLQRAGDRLHIIVSDDGVGGAALGGGSGLAGLAKRAESVDGTFEIASPPGGPTLLTVDLPCAR
jgi:signal transduction histidine kinase